MGTCFKQKKKKKYKLDQLDPGLWKPREPKLTNKHHIFIPFKMKSSLQLLS